MTVASRRPRSSPALDVCGIRLGPATPCVLGLLGPRPRPRHAAMKRDSSGTARGAGTGRSAGGIPGPHEARLAISVQPRASRNEIRAIDGAAIRVRVTAPPSDGAANDAVRDLLARALDCPRSAVEIVRGATARTKVVRVLGLSLAEV